MKVSRFGTGALPYASLALCAVWQSRMSGGGYFNNVMKQAPRIPNEASGEVGEAAQREEGAGYLTRSCYLLFHSPFLVAPIAIVATLWIMHDLYEAGVYGLFSSR